MSELAQAFLEKPDAEAKLVFQTELKRAEEIMVKAAVGDFAALEHKRRNRRQTCKTESQRSEARTRMRRD